MSKTPKATAARKKNGKFWIGEALANAKPGALHRQLHVAIGKKIPARTLEAAAGKAGKLGKRARLAITLRAMN